MMINNNKKKTGLECFNFQMQCRPWLFSGPDLEVESSGDDDDDGNIKQVVWQRQAWCLRSHRRCSGTPSGLHR